jgi:hypothetical protein
VFVSFAVKAIVGLPPDFLSNLLALAKFMRLSLMKAAHDDVGGAPRQEIRVAHLFRPMYAGANMGHPSDSLRARLISSELDKVPTPVGARSSLFRPVASFLILFFP